MVAMTDVSQVDAEEAAMMLAAVVDHRIDWVQMLREATALRVFFGTSVILSQHECSRCGSNIPVMAIRGQKICVDAHYFIEMEDGRTVFEFSGLDRIASVPSSICLPSYAVDIADIQEGFIERLLSGIQRNNMAAFMNLRFELANGAYRNLCPECDAAQDETVFISSHGSRFHPACPETERTTLYPENNTPLVLRSRLLPIADI